MIDRIRRIAGADAARESSETRYREIVERTMLGIIRTSFDGRVLMANPAAARILGYGSEAELAANVPDVREIYFDPEDRDEAIRIMRETGSLKDFTVRVRRSDGTPVWVLASAGPIIGDDGEPVGFEATMIDITTRKEGEEATEMLAAIVESSDDAIIGETLDGTITTWNSGAAHLFGYKAEEVIGKSMQMLIPPDRENELAGILLRIGAGEHIERYETQRLRCDGALIDVALTVSPIRNAQRILVGASVIVRDITQDKRREREETLLRRAVYEVSQAQDLTAAIAALGERAREAVTFDRVAFLVAEQPPWFRRVAVWGPNGWSSPVDERMVVEGAQTWRRLESGEAAWSDDTEDPDVEPFERELASQGIRSFICVPIVAAGEVRALFNVSSHEPGAFTSDDADMLSRLARECSGSLNTLMLLARERDVVERLRELDDLKNEFVGIVVHDLRSPLTVIGGFAEALHKHHAELTQDQQAEFLETITRNVHAMSDLIDDILDVARLESREMRFDRSEVDLGEIARTVAQDMEKTAEGARIDVMVEPNLPPASADPRRQRQILTNLLSNAVKFAGESPIEVRVSSDGPMLVVSVRDHGEGILPEDLPALFQRFSRVTQLGKKAKGTGLGLYICRLLVEGQGGTIDVRSEVGAGTTFTYTVPTLGGDG